MTEYSSFTVYIPGVRKEEKAPGYDTWIPHLEAHFSSIRPILEEWHNGWQVPNGVRAILLE